MVDADPVQRIAIAALVAVVLVMTGCSSDAANDSVVAGTSGLDPVTTTSSVGDSSGDLEDPDDSTTTIIAYDRTKAEPARTARDVEAPAGVKPDGFTTATVRVTSAEGEVCRICLWLADASDERGRGLMGVTDLGEPVGMLFQFEQPVRGNFYMFNTPMPLSIAWFTDAGSHVHEADMEPCLVDDSATCERYGPGDDYLFAIEMVQGELNVVGIGPGSTIEVLAKHDRCPMVE